MQHTHTPVVVGSHSSGYASWGSHRLPEECSDAYKIVQVGFWGGKLVCQQREPISGSRDRLSTDLIYLKRSNVCDRVVFWVPWMKHVRQWLIGRGIVLILCYVHANNAQ